MYNINVYKYSFFVFSLRGGQARRVPPSSPKVVLNVTGLPPGKHVMCSFRTGGMEPFCDRLQDVLNRKVSSVARMRQ